MVMSSNTINHIIIVGAGPSGLILSLLLSRADSPIAITLLEAAADLDTNPRAAHYAPSACYDLNRAGVLDDVRKEGFHPDSVCWRKSDGTLLGGLGWADGVDVESGPMVCLPLDRLDRLMLRHLLRYETAKILFRHRVVGLKQDERQAQVEVEVEDEDGSKRSKWLSADYVVGSDGANSMVRRLLFGESNYPGETLEKQIIATNVG
jgi:2-polyprenyl-6-methoxyphenol hydroxylase-like FAD-dependent oxidoreductase